VEKKPALEVKQAHSVVIVSYKILRRLPICFSIYAASSGVALGMTPGSLKLVRRKVDITNINIRPPTIGMAGVIRTAKNGQLERIQEYT